MLLIQVYTKKTRLPGKNCPGTQARRRQVSPAHLQSSTVCRIRPRHEPLSSSRVDRHPHLLCWRRRGCNRVCCRCHQTKVRLTNPLRKHKRRPSTRRSRSGVGLTVQVARTSSEPGAADPNWPREGEGDGDVPTRRQAQGEGKRGRVHRGASG